MMRQEIMREKKQQILKRVKTLATMDTKEIEEVEYDSIEDAYRSLKQEFDVALRARKPDDVYPSLIFHSLIFILSSFSLSFICLFSKYFIVIIVIIFDKY
jgi:hypothetical protein